MRTYITASMSFFMVCPWFYEFEEVLQGQGYCWINKFEDSIYKSEFIVETENRFVLF